MKCVVIIPARLGSARLQKKPLVEIKGKTLIRRVYENALKIKGASEVAVATDAESILSEINNIGGKCFLTPQRLASGSDRVYYTVREHYREADIIVNLQGDEPFIDTELIDIIVEEAQQGQYGLYSAYCKIYRDEAADENTVKVVLNKNDEAMFFSRSLIPAGASVFNKHIGLYVWKRDLLEKFNSWEQTKLEKAERLEQLRVLEHGEKIKMTESRKDSLGIDTPEDVEKAEQRI